jgi:hypothetical protein
VEVIVQVQQLSFGGKGIHGGLCIERCSLVHTCLKRTSGRCRSCNFSAESVAV